ncbi:MAG TPA: hypothetical protein VKZ78_03135 [Sphingobacteriaceae bacterium]|nr:hypothetical protein [Sphingobacteriaceae bacterium]
MIRVLINNLLRFVVLLAMQVFLFKNMGYYNLVTPFPYIFFLLLLPIGISNFNLYIIAFLTGLSVDLFYDTLGVNAAAAVVLALTRIAFLKITLEAENHDKNTTPMLGEVSFRWFLPYILLTTFMHHLTLFMLATFTFRQFHYTLFSTIFSCIFTVLIMLVFSLLIYRRKKR